jgi:hypothetical protein
MRNHWYPRYKELRLQDTASKQEQLPAPVAEGRYKMLVIRLEKRRAKLALETEISANEPILKTCTLANSAILVLASNDVGLEFEQNMATCGIVKLLAINAMFEAEETLGRMPRYLSAQRSDDYDIESVDATRNLLFIEVKGVVNGKNSVKLSINKVNIVRNSPHRFWLDLVNVKVDKATAPMYVRSIDWSVHGFGDTQITKNLQQLLAAGKEAQ